MKSSIVISFSLAKSCPCHIRLAMTCRIYGDLLRPVASITLCIKFGSSVFVEECFPSRARVVNGSCIPGMSGNKATQGY